MQCSGCDEVFSSEVIDKHMSSCAPGARAVLDGRSAARQRRSDKGNEDKRNGGAGAARDGSGSEGGEGGGVGGGDPGRVAGAGPPGFLPRLLCACLFACVLIASASDVREDIPSRDDKPVQPIACTNLNAEVPSTLMAFSKHLQTLLNNVQANNNMLVSALANPLSATDAVVKEGYGRLDQSRNSSKEINVLTEYLNKANAKCQSERVRQSFVQGSLRYIRGAKAYVFVFTALIFDALWHWPWWIIAAVFYHTPQWWGISICWLIVSAVLYTGMPAGFAWRELFDYDDPAALPKLWKAIGRFTLCKMIIDEFADHFSDTTIHPGWYQTTAVLVVATVCGCLFIIPTYQEVKRAPKRAIFSGLAIIALGMVVRWVK